MASGCPQPASCFYNLHLVNAECNIIWHIKEIITVRQRNYPAFTTFAMFSLNVEEIALIEEDELVLKELKPFFSYQEFRFPFPFPLRLARGLHHHLAKRNFPFVRCATEPQTKEETRKCYCFFSSF